MVKWTRRHLLLLDPTSARVAPTRKWLGTLTPCRCGGHGFPRAGFQRTAGALRSAGTWGDPRKLAYRSGELRPVVACLLAQRCYLVVLDGGHHLDGPEDAHPEAGLRRFDPPAGRTVPGLHADRRLFTAVRSGRQRTQQSTRLSLQCAPGLLPSSPHRRLRRSTAEPTPAMLRRRAVRPPAHEAPRRESRRRPAPQTAPGNPQRRAARHPPASTRDGGPPVIAPSPSRGRASGCRAGRRGCGTRCMGGSGSPAER